MKNAEVENYGEIERLEKALETLRQQGGTARETEAIREIGLEIALAVRHVGAMLASANSEQSGRSAPARADSLRA